MTRPKLSIVIVNWNVRDLLRDCLASVEQQMQLSPEEYETIVVDNDSHDGSVDMIASEFPWCRLIASTENLGFAAGSQAGYDISTGEFVLLLNPDTVVLNHAIDTMLDRMISMPQVGILGSRLLNSDGSFQRAGGGAFPSLANLAWNYLFLNRVLPARWAPGPIFIEGDPPGLRDIDWVSGASLMFRREAVGDRIFNPDFFMFGEDMDVCDRVRRGGWRVVYSAEQSITHHHGMSFAKQAEQQVLASVYKGPRAFFARTHNAFELFLYDLILFVGYGARWIVASLLARLDPSRDHVELARFSRDYLGSMLKTRFRSTGNAPGKQLMEAPQGVHAESRAP